MVTVHIESGRTTLAVLLGQFGNTEIRIIGATVTGLLALIILVLYFYVGEPAPRPPASGRVDVCDGRQLDDSDLKSREIEGGGLDRSEEREQKQDSDELTDAHLDETTLTLSIRGEWSYGLLVEVTDGERSEEFFVQHWTEPNPSVWAVVPRSDHDNWVAIAREYLRERAIRGDLTTGELDSSRTNTEWVVGKTAAASIACICLVALHYLLGVYSLSLVDKWALPLRLTDAIVNGTTVFDAMAADTVRYLVFVGGALAVLQENDCGVSPKQLTMSVFGAAVALPSGVLLVSGVDFDIDLGVSMARAAVFPTVAVIGFQRSYQMVVKESTDVSGEYSQHPLIRRVAVAFLRCQRVYRWIGGESIAVSDERVCHEIARQILVTTGIGSTLVGGLWFVETLRSGWKYLPNLTQKMVFLVGEFVQIGASVVVTMLMLTALVLVALWLTVRPIIASRVGFAVGVFSATCGVLNLFTIYAIPAPAEVLVGRVVRWSLVAPGRGTTVIWLMDILNVQEAVVLVGFAVGTHVLRRAASRQVSARIGSLRE